MPFDKFVFGKDIFLKTDFPVAVDSPDHQVPLGGSLDIHIDGTDFATQLLQTFGYDKTKMIDLGTGSGTVPMTSRFAQMHLAVGLEGSNVPLIKKSGCWLEYPEILTTCDISRPFEINDAGGKPVKFDYVTSWGVFEHIHPDRLDMLWQNCIKLMTPETWGIFNIDLGLNMFHQSGGKTPDYWRSQLEKYFIIDEEKSAKQWNYCRPTRDELALIHKLGVPWNSGRTHWWVKIK